MSLSLNAAEVRALGWVEEQHRGQGAAYHLEHFVDDAMAGWIYVRVRFVGRSERQRPDRHYILSSTGRVWDTKPTWAGVPRVRNLVLRDADYGTVGL